MILVIITIGTAIATEFLHSIGTSWEGYLVFVRANNSNAYTVYVIDTIALCSFIVMLSCYTI